MFCTEVENYFLPSLIRSLSTVAFSICFVAQFHVNVAASRVWINARPRLWGQVNRLRHQDTQHVTELNSEARFSISSSSSQNTKPTTPPINSRTTFQVAFRRLSTLVRIWKARGNSIISYVKTRRSHRAYHIDTHLLNTTLILS